MSYVRLTVKLNLNSPGENNLNLALDDQGRNIPLMT